MIIILVSLADDGACVRNVIEIWNEGTRITLPEGQVCKRTFVQWINA